MGRMDAVLEIDDDVAPRPRAGRRARARASRSSSTRGAGRSATSPTASPTRRSAAGSRRARRACSPTSTATSPTSRAALRVVTPGGHARRCARCRRTSTGPERARDDPRQRGPARHHHRGDRARAPPARASADPRLPASPTGTRGARGDARDRGERGDAVGHPRLRRPRDAVLVRDQARPARRVDQLQVAGAAGRSSSGARTSTSSRCASRSSATRAATAHVKAQRKLVGEIVSRARRPRASGSGPGELYDQKKFDTPYIRDFLLDRGALGRRVGDRGAVERAARALRRRDRRRPRGAFAELGVQGWIMCHLSHSYHSGACLYFTFAFKPSAARDAARRSTTW